jgi:hypothetical protein
MYRINEDVAKSNKVLKEIDSLRIFPDEIDKLKRVVNKGNLQVDVNGNLVAVPPKKKGNIFTNIKNWLDHHYGDMEL